MASDLSALRVAPDATMREAIAVITANRRQIALVVDDADRLLGIVTDGDIRRAILAGSDLAAPVRAFMNAAPLTGSRELEDEEIVEVLAQRAIRHLPIVDADGRVERLVMSEDFTRANDLSTPVVLMAGGRGQRLYPLTRDVPKPMLPIDGTPIIEVILRRLRAQGFVNVHISVNYLKHVIMDHVGDGAQFGLTVDYLHEDSPLGTAGALAGLRGRVDQPFVVMNSDLLTRVELRRMLSFHRKHEAAATIGVREHQFEIPFGVVELDGARVATLREKPVYRPLVNAGIYVLDPVALELIEPGQYLDMPTLLGMLMESGRDVVAFPIHETWLDVGRPEDLSAAKDQPGQWVD